MERKIIDVTEDANNNVDKADKSVSKKAKNITKQKIQNTTKNKCII